ncbi:hypothetical protein ACJ73_08855, partial [Blastomyces percursus]
DKGKSGVSFWDTELRPLFRLITHPGVVDSAVLEQEVPAIFYFLLGVVRQPYDEALGRPPRKQTDNFSKLATRFSELLNQASKPEEEFSHSQASKHLDYARQPLEIGDEIPIFQNSTLPVIRESFVRLRFFPPTRKSCRCGGNTCQRPTLSQWHIQGIRGLLDREFRLLKEDTVAQLRDAIRETFELIKNPGDESAGLELVVRCEQPSAAQNMSLIDQTGSVLFCVVSYSTKRSKDDRPAYQNYKPNEAPGDVAEAAESLTLSDDGVSSTVSCYLPTQDDLKRAKPSGGTGVGVHHCVDILWSSPGVLLASFEHTLVALQHMYEKPKIPFSNLIALPQYARKAGFTYDLTCLTHDNMDLTISPQRPPDCEELASRSNLDLTQSAALLSTLSTELSLIQGPPSTGKSYTREKIIKVLLENKRKAHLDPILCVCYTNHALDQLLVHLLDDRIKGIIRIGSRSKSERLEDFNLRSLVRAFYRTKSENSRLYHVDGDLHEIVRQTNDLLKELMKELFGRDEDGWETVIHQPEKVIDRWLMRGSHSKTQPRQLDALKQTQLSSMSHAERRTVHRHWLKSIRDPISSKIVKLYDQYTKVLEQRNRVRGDVYLRCLQQADIVGVTTTGLARNMDLLRKLHC